MEKTEKNDSPSRKSGVKFSIKILALKKKHKSLRMFSSLTFWDVTPLDDTYRCNRRFLWISCQLWKEWPFLRTRSLWLPARWPAEPAGPVESRNSTCDSTEPLLGHRRTEWRVWPSLWLPIPSRPRRCPTAAPPLYNQWSWCHSMDPPWEQHAPVSKTKARMSKTQILQTSVCGPGRDAPSSDPPRSRRIPPRTWPQPLHWRRRKWARWTRQTLVPDCEISGSMPLLRKGKQHVQQRIITPHIIIIRLIALRSLSTRCVLPPYP